MATKRKITYLVSYELAQPKGTKRDYKTLTIRLREAGFCETGLKSQWLYQCDEGTKAVAVSKKVLDVVNVSAPNKQVPPVFKPDTDQLLVSPYFPCGKGVIHRVYGGKDQPV